MNLEKTRKKILEDVKLHVSKKGWNEDIIEFLSNKTNFNKKDLIVLLPEKNQTLIKIYLDDLNKKIQNKFIKLNLTNLRTHQKIRELIIMRLKIMLKEKKLASKTFLYLLLPQNYKFTSKYLYKIVDEMWYLSGDNSTDFNFYSKRLILSSIYIATMTHFINNDNIQDTIEVLDKQLKKVSKIPEIKKSIYDIAKIVPKTIGISKKFSFFKQ